MGLLYKPLALVAKFLSKRVGQSAFRSLWTTVGDGEAPPPPNAGPRSLVSVFCTAAFEAAVLAGVGAVIDQLFGRFFHQIMGAWPGKPLPAPEDRSAPDA